MEQEALQDLNLIKELDEEIATLETKKEEVKELMDKTLKENKDKMAKKRRDHDRKKREVDEAKISVAAAKESLRTREGARRSYKPEIEALKEMSQVRENILF